MPSWRSRAPSADAALAAADHQDEGVAVRPRPSTSAVRASFHVTRSLYAPCCTPFGLVVPCSSSWPLSSSNVVSSVHAPSSFRRSRPEPRPTAVSKPDPRRDDAACLVRLLALGDPEVRCVGGFHRVPEQVGDAFAALGGRDVPGERDEVPPERGRGEQARGPIGVPRGERGREVRQPLLHALPGGRRGAGLRLDGLGHGRSSDPVPHRCDTGAQTTRSRRLRQRQPGRSPPAVDARAAHADHRRRNGRARPPTTRLVRLRPRGSRRRAPRAPRPAGRRRSPAAGAAAARCPSCRTSAR